MGGSAISFLSPSIRSAYDDVEDEDDAGSELELE